MKKVTLPAAEAVGAFYALQQFGNNNVRLSVAVAIAENIQSMKTGVEMYQERRNEKIKELGELTENGGYQVAKENLASFQRFDEELGKEEIMFSIIPVATANLGENYEIAPNMIAALWWMFDTKPSVEPKEKRSH